MIIGVPSEVKNNENRVGLTPNSVKCLVNSGHEILVQKNAGASIGFFDAQYKNFGAKIIESAEEVYKSSEMIVKVKEPIPDEYKFLRSDLTLFAYLHLAGDPDNAKKLIDTGVTGIAYETVTAPDGTMPLLAPMSAVAGRMSIQAGAYSLEKHKGGSGLLLGGAPGVQPGNVLILGGGVVGENAAIIATGMQAKVFIVDKSEKRLEELQEKFGDKIEPLHSDKINLKDYISECDLLIGGVLVPGSNAPKIITKDMIKEMKSGSVIVDVAIDQGGCVETSKPTTHANPTYVVDDVVHYCVANMPGGVPRTSTLALNAVTLPFIQNLASNGFKDALKNDKNFMNGLNIFKGAVTYKAIADDLNYDYANPETLVH